ncbi:hypothetical protein JCM8547_009168 [Rhodosporidiobolus lusitaniae]
MPSLMQTLLREPTRSYASIYTDPSSRPPTPSYTSSKRPSSVRSNGSVRSSSSLGANSSDALSGLPRQDAAWVNGEWEWSKFGGRGGLTGSNRSLHVPSTVGRSLGLDQQRPSKRTSSLRSATYDDEAGSIRSGRSGMSGTSERSERSTMSAPGLGESSSSRKKGKGKKSFRAPSSLREEYDYEPQQRRSSFGAEPSSQYGASGSSSRGMQSSRSASTSFLRGGQEQTSRRYSSMSAVPPSSYPTSPNLSALSTGSSSSRRRSKSPLRSIPLGDSTPSLTSSASSAPSSGPTTPVQPPLSTVSTLHLDGEGNSKKKTKKKRTPSVAQGEEQQVVAGEPVVTSRAEETVSPPLVKSAATVNPVPGKFYSVDELFALAAPATPSSANAPSVSAPDLTPTASATSTSTFVSAPSSPPPVSAPVAPPLVRAESDNLSFTTALDGSVLGPPELAPAVPRLRLTRTESDQSRAGVRGSEELVMDETVHEEDEEEESEEEEAEQTSSSEEEEEEEAVAATLVPTSQQPPPPAPAEPPRLAHFVNVKRAESKRSSPKQASPSRTYARSSPEPTYEVVRSSKSSTLSTSSYDPTIRSTSPSFSAVSSTSGLSDLSSSSAAATDVPDWLQRIRSLGEPIQPLSLTPPQQQSSPRRNPAPSPAPHLTVQQLRSHDSGSSSQNRPRINRPRSVASLRGRVRAMDTMPEEAEAEAAAAAEEQAARGGLQVTPAWVKRKDGMGVSPASSDRSVSPAPSNGSSNASPYSSRRSRSVDLSSSDRDRMLLKPTSPLSRSSSLSAGSVTSSRSTYSDADIAAIAAAADARPKKGLAKFLEPPLASSKAVKAPEPVVVRNRPASMHNLAIRNEELYSQVARASSLKEITPRRRTTSLRDFISRPATPSVAEEEQEEQQVEQDEAEHEDDADSACGRSALSTMSAPQLSPARPPKNPARTTPPVPSLPESFSRLASRTPPPPSAQIPLPGSRPSVHSASSSPDPAPEATDRPSPRPQSRSFSAVERPSMHQQDPPPPVPVLPAFARSASPTPVSSSAASTSAAAPSTRLFSSLLAPSALFNGPSALALSQRIDFGKKKNSRRFGLFKRASTADLSSSSSSGRKFDAQTDLVYEPVDASSLKSKVRGDEVVVEVIAAAVDRWDRERVWQVARGVGGAGFVPGRAVVGKVVEVGGVGKVKKGELVWAINSVKKSSAFASFITLSRDVVSPAPSSLPAEDLSSLITPASLAMLVMSGLCRDLPKGSKILVLNAHVGVGNLCLQLAHYLRPGTAGAGSRDLWMVAQVPISVNDGDRVCKEAGATDVLQDEPLAVINGEHESSYDVVIDTIGGRRIYDASRRILHHSGSFITTIGDSLTPSSSSSSNSDFRSLRRAFFKKDKKQVSYWRVDLDSDGSVKETLGKVKEVVDAGGIRPLVTRVVPFSEARSTFEARAAEDEGVVVRVKEV